MERPSIAVIAVTAGLLGAGSVAEAAHIEPVPAIVAFAGDAVNNAAETAVELVEESKVHIFGHSPTSQETRQAAEQHKSPNYPPIGYIALGIIELEALAFGIYKGARRFIGR